MEQWGVGIVAQVGESLLHFHHLEVWVTQCLARVDPCFRALVEHSFEETVGLWG